MIKKFLPFQLKELDKIYVYCKSKDKELKKVGRVLLLDFLKNNNLDNVYIEYNDYYKDYYNKRLVICDSNRHICKLSNVGSTHLIYCMTLNSKYLSKFTVSKNNMFRTNNRMYYLDSFFRKILV